MAVIDFFVHPSTRLIFSSLENDGPTRLNSIVIDSELMLSFLKNHNRRHRLRVATTRSSTSPQSTSAKNRKRHQNESA